MHSLNADQVEEQVQPRNCRYYCSFKYFKSWFMQNREHASARVRLGSKISYLSLYAYMHTIDRLEETIKVKEEKISCLDEKVDLT